MQKTAASGENPPWQQDRNTRQQPGPYLPPKVRSIACCIVIHEAKVGACGTGCQGRQGREFSQHTEHQPHVPEPGGSHNSGSPDLFRARFFSHGVRRRAGETSEPIDPEQVGPDFVSSYGGSTEGIGKEGWHRVGTGECSRFGVGWPGLSLSKRREASLRRKLLRGRLARRRQDRLGK